MHRTRVISTGRKSPVSRPASPRFAEFPIVALPPLPFRDPLNSPVLRSISPRSTTVPSQLLACSSTVVSQDQSKSYLPSDVQRPLSPLVFPVPHRESYAFLIQHDVNRSSRVTPNIQFKPRDLTGRITRDDMYVFACGSYGDVWKGSLRDRAGMHKVAIKVLRPPTEADRQKTNKRLCREIEVWKRLVHDNVVPLLGITTDIGPYTCTGMVSLWMENGNLNKFLQENSATLSVSGRFGLLCGIAAGLAYLHSQSVIHGDLTGANILIDGDGKALLVDFGLSTIKAEFEGTSYYSSTVGGALRWRAPELLSVSEDDVAPNLSTACDIYSYGSVALQVLSGKVPYHYFTENRVLIAVSNGIRPQRPLASWIADAPWMFIQLCWHPDQSARPGIEEVNDCVTAFHRDCTQNRLNVQQEAVSKPFPVINRHLRPVMLSTDGYETDSESLHASSPNTKPSGWLSEQGDGPTLRKFANKSRIIRPSTLPLVNAVRSQRKTARPTIRMVNLQALSAHWKDLVNHEVSRLATATHSNIRNIITVEGGDIISLTLEPIIGIPLSNIVHRRSLTNAQVSGLCSKIVNGLEHLHKLDIIHGHLNSSNILLDTQGCVKLTDFGLSAKIERERSNHVDTIDSPYWSAPEFITSGKYAPAMDIWSLGIVSIEMVEKRPPHFDKDPRTARKLIAAGGTPTLKDWQAFPWELVHFLSSCLVGNILERATASELCLHEFLANACSAMGLVPLLDVDMLRAR